MLIFEVHSHVNVTFSLCIHAHNCFLFCYDNLPKSFYDLVSLLFNMVFVVQSSNLQDDDNI